MKKERIINRIKAVEGKEKIKEIRKRSHANGAGGIKWYWIIETETGTTRTDWILGNERKAIEEIESYTERYAEEKTVPKSMSKRLV